MNYYPFHIGDYAVNTRHLSLMEDLAYRRLLDLYYSHNGNIPAVTESVSRLLGMREHVSEVQSVLDEFFVKSEDGSWSHVRCDEEIAKAEAASERARVNGKAGGRPVGSKKKKANNPAVTQPVPSGNPEESKSKAPITQSQDQIEKNPPTPKGEGRFHEFWASWPVTDRKQDRKKCLAKWQRHGWDAIADEVLEHVDAMKATRKWMDGYEPAPLTYLNGERWRDGVDMSDAGHQSSLVGAI